MPLLFARTGRGREHLAVRVRASATTEVSTITDRHTCDEEVHSLTRATACRDNKSRRDESMPGAKNRDSEGYAHFVVTLGDAGTRQEARRREGECRGERRCFVGYLRAPAYEIKGPGWSGLRADILPIRSGSRDGHRSRARPCGS
jgi:hypothetical protein